jgi:hypothetical protein
MKRFDVYRDSFANARVTRSQTDVLEVALHTEGSTLVFNGHTHEQFVDLFHTIASDPDSRVVGARAFVPHNRLAPESSSPTAIEASVAKSFLSNIYARYRHSRSGAAALSLAGNRLSA